MTPPKTPRRNGRVTPKKAAPKKLVAFEPIEVPPPVPTAPPGTLRLLKVVMQPVFVLVQPDGEVQEVQHAAFEIKGVDWAEWAPTAFTPDALEALRQQATPRPAGTT